MKIEEALRELREERRSVSAPPTVEAAVFAEFRRTRRKTRVAWWVWLVPAVAAAAIVLLMRPAPVSAPPSPPVVAAKVQPPPIVETVEPVAIAPVRKSAPKRAAPREVYTAFHAVPGGDPFAPFDRGQLVRVQLPRTAMSYFGLPVNPARGELVKADVVLGEDGMARAIRFVQDRY